VHRRAPPAFLGNTDPEGLYPQYTIPTVDAIYMHNHLDSMVTHASGVVVVQVVVPSEQLISCSRADEQLTNG
jgi:hypothetical protein